MHVSQHRRIKSVSCAHEQATIVFERDWRMEASGKLILTSKYGTLHLHLISARKCDAATFIISMAAAGYQRSMKL